MIRRYLKCYFGSANLVAYIEVSLLDIFSVSSVERYISGVLLRVAVADTVYWFNRLPTSWLRKYEWRNVYCSFSFHGTYTWFSPSRGSNCKSPTLTSHRRDSLTRGRYWTYLCRHFVLPTREFLLLCLRKLMIGNIRGFGHWRGLVTSEVWSLARCGH